MLLKNTIYSVFTKYSIKKFECWWILKILFSNTKIQGYKAFLIWHYKYIKKTMQYKVSSKSHPQTENCNFSVEVKSFSVSWHILDFFLKFASLILKMVFQVKNYLNNHSVQL